MLFKNFVNGYSPVTIMKWMFTYALRLRTALLFRWGGGYRLAGARGWCDRGDSVYRCGRYVLELACSWWSGRSGCGLPWRGCITIQPLVASIVAVCWGMDRFNVVKVLAVVLIFGGVYLVTVSPSRRALKPRNTAMKRAGTAAEGPGAVRRTTESGCRINIKDRDNSRGLFVRVDPPGLEPGTPDYESGATNQLSYGSVLFRSLFRCREAVVRTGAQKYINSVEMQKKRKIFRQAGFAGPACRLAMRAEGAQYPFRSGGAGRGYRFGEI